MTEPIGDLCVLRNDELNAWVVSLCRGHGTRDQLGQFPTREEASSFAVAERNRLRTEEGLALDVHLPDDCPCLCPEPAVTKAPARA